ncbi:zinc finger protein 888 [Harpegnathos saltator]|uniref:zinc finger protein 888 n=1 Tax=Harpegnathos saltator TaxID=610380 RepID=UPI00058FFEB9|nr:zinc finger protein 888 [Harpegnathos saltator]
MMTTEHDILQGTQKKCIIMSQECPNCGQLTNASYSRLVKDSCGHTKCRMCLLYEEHGCKTCQAVCCTQDIQDYREACSTSNDPDDTNKANNEENILPLELVINKNTKSKEHHNYNPTSIEHRLPSFHHKDVSFSNNKRAYESVTNDAIDNNDSDKLYIPKVEPSNMVLNIEAHLRNGSNQNDLANLENPQDTQAEPRLDEKTEKSKNTKRRDRSHIMIVSSNPEKYQCNVCGKIFRNKKGKCYHDACVTGIRPYQCTLCDRSFVKRSHFEYHERVHSGHRPHKCTLCEKAFPQRNKLNRHMLSHSKEKQFLCSICNKRYSKRDDLKNHLNEHNATTTYTCKFCDKPFCILTNLKRHMRTHTSERPHTCDQCGKSFKDKSMLIRHKRTHGKERPFSCAHCNRVFLSKSELRRHLVVHSDEKPFSCEYCQTQFRRKDNLNRHVRHHHSEDFSCGEVNNKVPPAVVKADRNCSTKSRNQQPRQKQKSRKTQPKSPGKVVANSTANSHQINSRLDPMGNITPVIRTTAEVSNAVSVINGPISTRRLEERACKKMFTYMEPIPIAEAAVLNCRIEEKLYPQSANSHNYFVHNYLKDRNSKVNSYPNNDNDNELESRDNSNAIATISSSIQSSLPKTTTSQEEPATSIREDKCHRDEGKTKKVDESTGRGDETSVSTERLDATSPRDEQSNCVSTIKKHTVQQLVADGCNSSASGNFGGTATHCATLPKDFQNSSKRKQSDVHWRRRTAETLKPCRH